MKFVTCIGGRPKRCIPQIYDLFSKRCFWGGAPGSVYTSAGVGIKKFYRKYFKICGLYMLIFIYLLFVIKCAPALLIKLKNID